MEKFNLPGGCGLYCGACGHYRAFRPDSNHLLEAITAHMPDFEECHGCRSDVLTEYCSNCSIRKCTSERGMEHCGLCPEYPCKQLKSFQRDGRIHHIVIMDNIEALKEREPEQWLDEQNRRWECSCGQRFSWYEETCSQCGAPLPSYGPRSTGA